MTEEHDPLEGMNPEKKPDARKFDAWDDLRVPEEDGEFDNPPSGVIDIHQKGSLFEVLSETRAKELAAALAELQSAQLLAREEIEAADGGEPAFSDEAEGEAPDGDEDEASDEDEDEASDEDEDEASDEDEDEASDGAGNEAFDEDEDEASDEDEDEAFDEDEDEAFDEDEDEAVGGDDDGEDSEVLYELRFEPPSATSFVAPFGELYQNQGKAEAEPADEEEAEPLRASGEEGSIEADEGRAEAAHEMEPAPPYGKRAWVYDEDDSVLSPSGQAENVDEALDEPTRLYGIQAEAYGEGGPTPPDEEEYSHPFFDLPPLERSIKKRKRERKSRSAGIEAQQDEAVLSEGYGSSGGVELWKILLAVLICMLFAIGSYFVGQVYGATLIPDEPAFIIPPEGDASGDTPIPEIKGPQILTVLVMGTDEREKGEQARADTIILAAINLDTRDIHLISIPRDTRTLIADTTTTTKINHAHTLGGAELMVKTVENLLGINVHYYMETNFKGFANCVDILGGMDYNVERRMLYPEEGIDLYPGQQRLDGDKALQYVRWRGDPTADIGRVGRQQKFIKAFLEQAINLGTITRLPSLIAELKDNINSDMSAVQMANLALRFVDIHNLSLTAETLPGEGKTIGGGAYWVMDEAAAKEMIMGIYDPGEAESEPAEAGKLSVGETMSGGAQEPVSGGAGEPEGGEAQ